MAKIISVNKNKNVSESIYMDSLFQWQNIKKRDSLNDDESLPNGQFTETVMFDVNDVGQRLPKSIPSMYLDAWDSAHVRMPCSPQNTYINNGISVSIWEIIEKALSGPLNSVELFAEAVFCYNQHYKGHWSFDHLSAALTLHPEFTPLLKDIATLALRLPHLVTQPIPLFVTGKEASISLSQLQVACLLANAFYCTFPRRNVEKRDLEYGTYPTINFNTLFGTNHNNCKSSDHKVVSLLHYFSRILSSNVGPSQGVVTFTRRCLKEAPNYESSPILFDSISFGASTSRLIEDSSRDTIQANFANRFLGGGVLRGGCVQEEILLVIKPEIIVGRLFIEVLSANETLIIEGAARYSTYTGYGNTFKWEGDYDEELHGNTRDSRGRWKGVVTVIDAIPFRDSSTQFSRPLIDRDVNKAYAGFSDRLAPYTKLPNTVVSGHWGCGAFGGNKAVKFLIQLLACAQSGKSLAYCTFHDEQFTASILRVYTVLCQTKTTVGMLYNILVSFNDSGELHNRREWSFVLKKVLENLVPTQIK